MSNKIIIYGGSGGIGSMTGKLLRERGHELHLVGREEGKLSKVAEELGASYTVGDVTDDQLFKRITQEAGDVLDGLVYAIGTINLRSFSRLNEQDFLNDFQVNALGAARAIQAALPALKKSENASVVLYSSIAAIQGFALHASIGMAKAAVSGLTISLAAELAPKIRVNAIAPSLTQTPLGDKVASSEQMQTAIAGMHPLPRLGTPMDIASLTAFLISTESSWITGQIFSVDGGRSTLRVKG
ncbi:MAG: SDR family oxidoreductase [Anaerolineaceae bacterium]|nr:SDR family oxidoreductase [Anaerolineaceae bacterium]